MQLEIGNL